MKNPTQIIELSAKALSIEIHKKGISCSEVMAAYLHQIDSLNDQVNAIVSLQNIDELIWQAKLMDLELAEGKSRGWMHGFPLAPKDLTATKGIPTTFGASYLKKNVMSQDSILVERMRASGAILIGKTNVPEFGLGSHTYNDLFGTTLNAFDLSKSAGGSSGGAAVALALNFLPVADGSDMGGSLRNPAAWNNVYGFRPSCGRVPFGPTSEVFYEQLGTEGPMARNVPDLAMLLSVQAGYDVRAPLCLSENPEIFTQRLEKNFKRTRVGWMGDLNSYLPMEAGIMDLYEKALPYFETMGCTVAETHPRFDMAKLWKCWLNLRAFLVAGKLKPFYKDPNKRQFMKPEAIWEFEQGSSLTAMEVYEASEVRSAWAMELNRLFETYDYLVLPATQIFPFEAHEHWPKEINGKPMDTYHRWMEVVIGATLAGLPTLSVPAGFNSEGLPLGLQIIGKPRQDLSVLQFGYAWQCATPFSEVRSPLLRQG